MSTAHKRQRRSFERKGGRLTRAQLSPELGDGDSTALELTNEDVLETAATNLLELRELLRWNLTFFQSQTLKVEFELWLRFSVVFGQRRCSRLVLVDAIRTKEDRRRLFLVVTACSSPDVARAAGRRRADGASGGR